MTLSIQPLDLKHSYVLVKERMSEVIFIRYLVILMIQLMVSVKAIIINLS